MMTPPMNGSRFSPHAPSGAQTAPLVELRNVQFSYSVGGRAILDDFSLTVPRGKVTAIMGASGGGKTTVLRLVGGQQKATQGQVLFDGLDMGTASQEQIYAARRRMGMLFQFGALFTDMSVFDNVAFPLREHTRLPPDMIRDIVLMKLHAVGSDYIANILESRARKLPEPGALHLTRRSDLLDISVEAPDLSIYESRSTTNKETP